MHILLTDVLTCPRCGPAFGLILLADRLEDRRVLEGSLGCPNCRERYPVRGGVADLRPILEGDDGAGAEPPEAGGVPGEAEMPAPAEPAGAEIATAAAPAAAREEKDPAFRLAALLGVAEGPGLLLVAGPVGELGPGIADRIEGIEVVVVDPARSGHPAGEEERSGVSRVAARGRLPLADRSVRGAAVSGAAADAWLEDAGRAVDPPGRLVLLGAPADADARLRAAGFEVLAREGNTVVAEKRGSAAPLKLYQLLR